METETKHLKTVLIQVDMVTHKVLERRATLFKRSVKEQYAWDIENHPEIVQEREKFSDDEP